MRWRNILFLLVVFVQQDIWAAKRDFKGLFGSYRRERFTENEARDIDFGVEFSLSTLLPISSLVSSSDPGPGYTPLNYAAFFNAELAFLLSFNYHFQTFFSVGYYDYSTRKENAATAAAKSPPQFHDFDLTAAPVLVGLRYRLGTEDIVPYLGAGIGMANIHQNAYYDYASVGQEKSFNALAGELIFGCEFYISSRVGLRLEMSGYIINIPAATFSPEGTTSTPRFQFAAAPILLRYSSGLFWLF